jgi:triacylglycerol lipase
MPYPIVLAHGICRFDVLWNTALRVDDTDDVTLDELHYFRGIRTMLRRRGHRVYHSRVAFGAKVDTRARQLGANVQRILQETRADKVNIIAHSMGGLDARHLMFNDRTEGRIHERIASLTTISTPHWGSPFADWGLQRFPNLTGTLKKVLVDVEGLHDLETDACRRFNERPEVEAFEAECERTIRFQTYAGRQSRSGIVLLLQPSFDIIEAAEGDNDGLVSVRSARWRDPYFKGVLENADHLNELAHWDGSQRQSGETSTALRSRVHAFYAAIAAELP